MSEALATIDTKPIESKLASLIERSQSILSFRALPDKPHFVMAREIQRDWTAYIKAVGFEFDPGIAKAKDVLDHLRGQKEKFAGPAKLKMEEVRRLADDFAAEEKRLAQVEQDAINAENARLARIKADEERRAAELVAAENRKERVKEINSALKRGEIGKREAARLLKEAGAAEEAAVQNAAAQAEETAANPPQVQVKPSLPTVAGTKSQTFYFGDVENAATIIDAFLAAPDAQRREFLRRFITVNVQEVGRFARDTKDNAKATALLPGVKFWSKG